MDYAGDNRPSVMTAPAMSALTLSFPGRRSGAAVLETADLETAEYVKDGTSLV